MESILEGGYKPLVITAEVNRNCIVSVDDKEKRCYKPWVVAHPHTREEKFVDPNKMDYWFGMNPTAL